MRVKRERTRKYERWMAHRMLPESLKERIRRYERYLRQETGGIEEEELVRNLPKDLRRDIKRHLFLALVRRVSAFHLAISSYYSCLSELLGVICIKNSFY